MDGTLGRKRMYLYIPRRLTLCFVFLSAMSTHQQRGKAQKHGEAKFDRPRPVGKCNVCATGVRTREGETDGSITAS